MSPVFAETSQLWNRRTIDPVTGCWVWSGARQVNGYGKFIKLGKQQYVHRTVFQNMLGPIPVGMVLDHKCRNRACCNPVHLEVVTNKENILRGVAFSAVNAKKTHCPQGHEYTRGNTYLGEQIGGINRRCKICTLASNRRSVDKKKARVSL